MADEARIFPLMTLQGRPSPHITPICRRLTGEGLASEIVPVAYELQRGGNQMLRVRRV